MMSSAVTAPSASVFTALEGVVLRHVKSREADLSTRFLHVSFEPLDSAAAVSAPTPDQVYSVFAAHGEVDGVTVPTPRDHSDATVAASSRPQRPFACVSFALKQQAARAIQALNKKASPLLPAFKLHIHPAVVREGQPANGVEQESTAAGAAAAAAALPSSATNAPLPRPAGVHVVSSFVTADETSRILDSIAYLLRGEVSFGHARKVEDGMFGLKKPKPIDESLYGDLLQRISRLDLAQLNDNTSSSAPTPALVPKPNRLTLSVLHPGQGVKRSHDSKVYGDVLSILNLGPSHTVVEIYPSATSTAKHSIFVHPGEVVFLSGDARLQAEYAIPARTRDVLPASMVDSNDATAREVNLKRGKATILFARQIVNVDAEEAPSVAAQAGKLKAKADASSQQDAKEKKEKTVKSTAIRVPTAARESTSASASSSSAVVDQAAEAAAAAMEDLHVRGVYDAIATHFSNTRHTPWPRIEAFVESIAPGLEVGDIGCGNGKYMGLNKGIRIRGCDSSKNLVQICRERGYDVIEGDIQSIPFESESFDVVLCIAVLHHLSTPLRRVQAAAELLRVLRPGGRLLVSAWALEQDATSRRAFPSQDVLVPWNVPRRYLDADGAQEAEQVAQLTSQRATEEAQRESDAPPAISAAPLVDPSSGGELLQFQRYCHVYKQGELEALFTTDLAAHLATSTATNTVDNAILESYYDRGNWCIVVQKGAPANTKA